MNSIMKIKITFLLLFVSAVSFAQIKVKEASEDKQEVIGELKTFGEVQFFMTKSENMYIMSFKDINFTKLLQYETFTFNDVDNAFESLYKLIIDGFESKPDEPIVLELPEGDLEIHFPKLMGIVNVQFKFTKKSNPSYTAVSGGLTEKKVMKLFGKDEKKKKKD